MKMKLYGYQEEMLRRIGSAFREHRAVMAQMPTGTGKTYLLAAVVKAYVTEGSRRLVLIVAHRRELVEQIKETCERFGLSNVVRVKSIQWLHLHLNEMEEMPGMIVIDEAHHALAKTYRGLWEAFPEAKILGLTATPYRLNGKGFEDLFEVLITSLSVREFIRMKRLSLFDYVSIKGDSEEQRLVDSLSKRGADGDYQIKEMGLVLNNRPTIEKLFQTFSKYAGNKKGIVYAIDIAHARAIAQFYCEHGIHAVVIDSKTKSLQRKELLEKFKKSSAIQVLVNVDIFSEGFDCPDVEVVQLARPTLSLAKYLQMVGRGLRVAEGKECCTIIDNVGLYRLFGLPSEDWDWQRMFLGWKKKELESLRGASDDMDSERGLVALQSTNYHESSEARNEELDREVGLVISHDVLRRAMEELPEDYDRYEVRHYKEKRWLTVWDTWNQRKVVVNIFCNEMRYDRRGLLLNCCTGYKKWEAIDLKNMQRYPVGGFPSAKVCYFGKLSLLKINNLYITRTQKPYTCVFPINERDVEWHGFHLLIHDPQSPRPLPVCVLAQNDASTYWWIAELEDGGICVMDDEEHFFFAYPDKPLVKVSREKGRALMPSEKSLQAAAEHIEQEHQVEVKPVDSKVALYVDGKMVVPPLYRKMVVLEHGYCKVQVRPQQWGLITMVGKLVVKPDYADVRVIDEQHAVITNMVGKEKVVKVKK